ncbi:hypothetical protein BGZ83_010485 [Gryganskiella cystojenkinii]|nr:hypothetical protein BGZ83_010485 [Gryganskiella cystojenkinii]
MPDARYIPEILLLVSEYLDRRTILDFLYVCRVWRDVFIPVIWSSVKISWKDGADRDCLDRYAALIERLSIYTDKYIDIPREAEIHCPILTHLDINLQLPAIYTKDSMLNVIKNHQGHLRHLQIQSETVANDLTVIEGCGQLESLRLKVLRLTGVNPFVDHFESLWSRIPVLSIGGIFYFIDPVVKNDPQRDATLRDKIEKSSVKTTKLRDLDVNSSGPFILPVFLPMILKSPELTRLRWSAGPASELTPEQVPMHQLIVAIRTGRWTGQAVAKIEYLDLPRAYFQIAEFKDLLQATTGLKSLGLAETNFNLASWSVLSVEIPRYLTTLRKLDLRTCQKVTGLIAHDILCRMMSLEDFAVDYVKVSDLLRDRQRSWTCLGLKSLKMAFVMTGDNVMGLGADQHALSRLAKLTQLEELSLRMTYYDRYNQYSALYHDYGWSNYDLGSVHPDRDPVLVLTLASGLDQLRGLKRLRVFEGPVSRSSRSDDPWGAAEARWVLEHWLHNNFEGVSGIALESKARDLLENSNIRTVGCPSSGPGVY